MEEEELNEEDLSAMDDLLDDAGIEYGKGYLVVTKHGLSGFTLHADPIVKGKIPVYTDCGKKLLCDPDTLKETGIKR